MDRGPSQPDVIKCADKEVQVMQVIRTTNHIRGQGIESDPMRRVTQFWSMDGDLLAEVDPLVLLERRQAAA